MNLDRLDTLVTVASTIHGWMTESELRWLGYHAARCTRILEIGVWKGRTSIVLLGMTPGYVDAVDPFVSTDDVLSDELRERGADAVRQDYLANTSLFASHRGMYYTSRESAVHFLTMRAFDEQPYDFIFIDGAHDFTNVQADIRAYTPFLKPEGILAGHDWWIPMVNDAVQRTIQGPIDRPVGEIWSVKSPRLLSA